MKLYRYMSMKEFDKLNAGTIEVTGKHIHNAKTTSAGICFIGEHTCFSDFENKKHDFSPEACYSFLKGIVSDNVLVEFETDAEVNKTTGLYADPFSPYFDDCICITEYCMDKYSAETVQPIRYCFPGEFIWYDWN